MDKMNYYLDNLILTTSLSGSQKKRMTAKILESGETEDMFAVYRQTRDIIENIYEIIAFHSEAIFAQAYAQLDEDIFK